MPMPKFLRNKNCEFRSHFSNIATMSGLPCLTATPCAAAPGGVADDITSVAFILADTRHGSCRVDPLED